MKHLHVFFLKRNTFVGKSVLVMPTVFRSSIQLRRDLGLGNASLIRVYAKVLPTMIPAKTNRSWSPIKVLIMTRVMDGEYKRSVCGAVPQPPLTHFLFESSLFSCPLRCYVGVCSLQIVLY